MNWEQQLNLRHIRTFLEIARAESVSLAADRLNVTQPAVSRSLKELEGMLGVRLFDRVGRRLRLNEAGRIFQGHASASMTELMRGAERLTADGDLTGRLSIGVLPTAATDLVPRAALVGLLVLIAGGIALCVFGSDVMDPRIGLRTAMLVCGVCLFFISMFCFKGFMLLEPNEARVVMFFGKYKGTFYETGFWWINPFMGRKKISVRARNLNVEPIKVNDKNGNPVMIGLVLVWKIRPDEIYRAVFDIDASTMGGTDLAVSASARMKVLENFVSVQSDAALRQVAGYYAYDNNGVADDELTLRSNSDEINDQLEAKLNDRLSMAGIEVIEARINYLAYAPEIAAVMLRRQQADAIISAREKIVEGAVTMVKMALDRLADDRIVELDEERKAAMVSNLLVVLCADEAAQPIVNAGTLHH